MSMRLLAACQLRETIIHTALDDLESFLWVLIWGIVHASKDIQGANNNRGIRLMLKAWSGNVQANATRLSHAETNWQDAVFGALVKEWLGIFKMAREGAEPLMRFMPTIPLDNQRGSQWSKACDWLESHCRKTYEDILKSGFNHFKDVEKYTSWEDVVAANEPQPMIF
jgi:hypothetical protein